MSQDWTRFHNDDSGRQHSIHLDGQAQNPGLPSLRECISSRYDQARWLYELPGMVTDPESDEWANGVRTIRIPHIHLGIRIGTSGHGPLHCITSIQAGSMIARNGNSSGVNDSSQCSSGVNDSSQLFVNFSRTLIRSQPLQ